MSEPPLSLWIEPGSRRLKSLDARSTLPMMASACFFLGSAARILRERSRSERPFDVANISAQGQLGL